MKYISAATSFLFVFVGIFFLAGWFLMPHLPPVPDRPISVFEGEYWVDNWIGVVLGIPIGLLSARSVLKKAKVRKESETRDSQRLMDVNGTQKRLAVPNKSKSYQVSVIGYQLLAKAQARNDRGWLILLWEDGLVDFEQEIKCNPAGCLLR